MSVITLTTYVIYDKRPNAVVMAHGLPAQKNNGRWESVVTNISLPVGMAPPANGITMLYGLRDTGEECHRRFLEASNNGRVMHHADFMVEVGDIPRVLVDNEVLKTTEFVSVKRMRVDLQGEILAHFQRFIEEEGGMPAIQMSKISDIATRPDLFGRLVDTVDEWRHIKVFAYPVSDGKKMRQVATVFPGAKLVEVVQNTGEDVFVTPANQIFVARSE